ncbi:CHAT domain-containing tetratricopeptide repeat protein [Salinarimonas sp.]|uniref:CHAT domain-containing tetratricopeptide repeat protein n=1 Tax=Salinarimonas sp. TaxID=2766526 RepID=UPI0032D8ED34
MRRLASALLCLLLVLAVARAPAQDGEVPGGMGDVQARVVELYRAGDYAGALSLARAHLASLEVEFGTRHLRTVEGLNLYAAILSLRGRDAEARPLTRRAFEIRLRVHGLPHPETTAAMFDLAMVNLRLDQNTAAEKLLRAVVKIRAKTLGVWHEGTLAAAYELAGAYSRQARLREAEPIYRWVLQGSSKKFGPEHRDTLVVFESLAGLLEQERRFPEAELLRRRVLAAYERTLGAEHERSRSALTALARHHLEREQLDRAEKLFLQIVEMNETTYGEDNPATLEAISNLAYILDIVGNYSEAEELYISVISRSSDGGGLDRHTLLRVLSNLAGNYWDRGRFGEAETLLLRVLRSREDVLRPDHPDIVRALNNLGLIYLAQERYEEAEELIARALDAQNATTESLSIEKAITLNNLALVLLEREHLKEAGLFYLRALVLSEELSSMNSTISANIMHNYSIYLGRLGQHDDAQHLSQRALESFERRFGREHPQTLSSRAARAAILFSSGRIREAQSMFERLLNEPTRADLLPPLAAVAARANLAALYQYRGLPSRALAQLRLADERLARALTVELRTTHAEPTRRTALEAASRYQDAAFSLAVAHPAPEATTFAFDLLLRWKMRRALDDAVVVRLLNESDDPEAVEAARAVRDGARALSRAVFDAEQDPEGVNDVIEALDAAEARLRLRSPEYAEAQQRGAVGTTDVQAALESDEALVELRLYRQPEVPAARPGAWRLLAGVLRADGAPTLVDLGEAAPLEALRERIVQPGDDAQGRARQVTAARDLDAALIAPLLPHLDGVDRLYLVPDGAFNAMPFAALKDRQGRLLIDRFDLRLLQTGRDLAAPKTPLNANGLLVFGGIDYGPLPRSTDASAALLVPAGVTSAGPESRAALGALRAGDLTGFAPLAYSGAEAEAITELYAALRPEEPVSPPRLGRDASEAALMSLAQAPRVLHLATHGYYLDDMLVPGRPLLQAGVALADANRALDGGTGADGENGILHAFEAQALDLRGTELVVVSACRTALGAVDYSEGLEGLPRAFYVAGARNVLLALWNIDDLLTQRFMASFYWNWLTQTGPSDPAAALQATQREFAGSADPVEADPATWAAFVLFEG